MSLILSPFSWLLDLLNGVFNNYGIAIMIFAVFLKLVLFPFSIKGKRGMIQMSMISGEMEKLKKQYGNDQARYSQEIQALYLRENVNPLGGCLWSILPMFVILPLYAVIRAPVENILGLSEVQLYELANLLEWDVLAVELNMVTQDILSKALEKNAENGIFSGFQNTGYNQLFLASLIPVEGILLENGFLVERMNFHLFNIDLTKVPNWKIWQDFSLQNFVTLGLVAVSVFTGIIYSRVAQKTNKMTSDQQAKNPQMEQTNRMMMWMMPLMSIWIGLVMPSIMVLFWICNNLLSMVQEVFAGKILKKDYEAMHALKEKQAKEAKEEEKRLKEEKIKEIERRKVELSKQKQGGKKKKKKGEEEDTSEKIDKEASKIGMRTYARGRAYDPNRYPNPHLIGQPSLENSAENANPSEQFQTIDPLEKLESIEIPEEQRSEEILLSSEKPKENEKRESSKEESQKHSPLSTATEEEKVRWEEQKRNLRKPKSKDL